MQKSLFFLNFLTIKVTSNYTVLKVISTGQICITSMTRTKSLKETWEKLLSFLIKFFTLVITSRMFRSLLPFFMVLPLTAVKSNYPNREVVSGFLNVIHAWWTISNSKQRCSANPLGNAIVLNDNKTNFFHLLAFWIQEWSISHYFTLTPQTSSALIRLPCDRKHCSLMNC